jgi:serine/threonine-protein kinase HipA
MNRKAMVYMHGEPAGLLTETESGYSFQYYQDFANLPHAQPISKTMPLQQMVYTSNVLFPFFDGLIPEGWLLHLVEQNWKLNEKDRFGLLLHCCKNCIGAVSVIPTANEEL